MELNLVALGAALAMQVTLAPCTIEGVAGPARCGSYKVWEDRAAKAGRQIELSIVILSSLEAARSDPFFMLQGGPHLHPDTPQGTVDGLPLLPLGCEPSAPMLDKSLRPGLGPVSSRLAEPHPRDEVCHGWRPPYLTQA